MSQTPDTPSPVATKTPTADEESSRRWPAGAKIPAHAMSTRVLAVAWLLLAPITLLFGWAVFGNLAVGDRPFGGAFVIVPFILFISVLALMTYSYCSGRKESAPAPEILPAHDPAAATDGSALEKAIAQRNCPCLRCGYNLRGLPRDINCPECGCPVARTLDMVEAQILCPNCLTPTHPSQPVCAHCGGPLTGSGSIAAFAGGQLHIPARGSAKPDSLHRAPLAPVIMIWVFLAPIAIPLTIVWIAYFRDLFDQPTAHDVFMWLVMGFLAAVVDLPLFLVSRAYLRRRHLPDSDEDEAPLPPTN